MNAYSKGLLKSVTIWAAFVVGISGDITALFTPALLGQLGLDAHTVLIVSTVWSAMMIACRHITSESLTEKGSAPIVPPPAS